MALTNKSGPAFKVDVNNHGDLMELGPGSVGDVGTVVIDFEPSIDWIGQFVVMGRVLGEAARIAGASMKPISYRLVNKGNVAAGYEMLSDAIGDSAMIQVPANGVSVGLLVACTQGSMMVIVYRIAGPSAV